MKASAVYDSAARPAPAVEEFLEIWRYRQLVWEFTKRDVVTRYKRSFLGVIWTMLNPLGTMIIMTIVFSQLFHQTAMYPVYVLTGLITWAMFQQTSTAAPQTLLWSHSLIHKVYLPRTIFAFTALGAATVNFVLSLIPLAVVMVVAGAAFKPCLLVLPLSMLLLGAFSLGMGLMLSSVVAMFPDVLDIYAILMTAWLYMSAIFYPYDIIPESYRWWFFNLNPMYHLVLLFRDPIYYGNWPSFAHIATAAFFGIGTLLIGWFVFTRKADELAYRI